MCVFPKALGETNAQVIRRTCCLNVCAWVSGDDHQCKVFRNFIQWCVSRFLRVEHNKGWRPNANAGQKRREQRAPGSTQQRMEVESSTQQRMEAECECRTKEAGAKSTEFDTTKDGGREFDTTKDGGREFDTTKANWRIRMSSNSRARPLGNPYLGNQIVSK